ncbi:MAG TPA: thiamine phosphate synthase [Candidatus Methylomirabilis sp.]
MKAFRLCAITDVAGRPGLTHAAAGAAALAGGAPCVQLRAKALAAGVLLREARALRAAARASGALFIVNDRLDVALAADADGVHLGQDDLPAARARRLLPPGGVLGISTHTLEQARRAADAGADYIGAGPVFATATKETGYAPLGLAGLAAIAAAVPVPVVAIGGIGPAEAPQVIRAGAMAAAVISALMAAPDIAGATRALLARLAAEGIR